ncbi:DNA polymerase-4 [Clostridium cavendishii DSM 21758]|uniref:DNA polymerase IV n=1 Tax=Clostridium cavendishii DSM 21758 TaxID=1121302 RepID=A0A1M6FM18_9CLOT|nr:DNA polymerase IV [Clostridium cavendishii]SHI98706.1 DNA polymerase-4 [Clostridium cavendishii DSM 21758]
MERNILHVDMDAFFASVEIMDDISLKGKPVIVGGTSERGVVSTCSYEARKYGVKSAMPVFIARNKCPNGIFITPRIYRYKEISLKIFEILYSFTDKVEGVSIDEAYLDVTDLEEDPVKIALSIKAKVKKNLGLNISVGVSYNKFLAKLASDWNKPNGLKIITEDMVPEILKPLAINKVHGLGFKAVNRLNNIGIFKIEELLELPKELFVEYFGKFGLEIYERIRGIDNREVIITRERKSIGKETTLKQDTDNKEELKVYLEYFSSRISSLLKRKNLKGRTITLKLKTSHFENHTKSKTLNNYINNEEEIYLEGLRILLSLELNEPIRLIGLSISSLTEECNEQITFFNN